MLDELDVDGLVGTNAHEMERSAALSDHLEIVGVLGVVESAKRTIFDTESIFPEVEDSC